MDAERIKRHEIAAKHPDEADIQAAVQFAIAALSPVKAEQL
jgi:hypothetical protein